MGEFILGSIGADKMSDYKIRILMARFDLDGHDRGILTVIKALVDAGMEVIYIHFSNPKEIAKAAIEEHVDLVGITSSLGQHLLVSSLLLEEFSNNKVKIPVIMGGVIPDRDVSRVLEMGMKKVFGPGSKPQEVASFISQIVQH